MMGQVLGERRKDIVLATKCGMAMGEGPYLSGSSRRYIVSACEASLKRLATDYIDLYQIHQPDPSTPKKKPYPRSMTWFTRAKSATSGIATTPDGSGRGALAGANASLRSICFRPERMEFAQSGRGA